MGCFKLEKARGERYNIYYEGIRTWTKKDDRDQYEVFLKKLLDNGGMGVYKEKADKLYSAINPQLLEYLAKNNYGFDQFDISGKLMTKNSDLFDGSDTIIARVTGKEVKSVIDFHSKPVNLKRAILDQVVERKMESPYKYNEEAMGLVWGERVPASKRGLSPDFRDKDLEKYIYNGDLRNADIPIKMSGSYTGDKMRAIEWAGIDPRDPALQDITLHHLDDIHIDRNGFAACTAQLVNEAFHGQVFVTWLNLLDEPFQDTIIAGRHVGSVSLWKGCFNVPYK